jgi:Methyltransferase domain
MLSDPGSRSLIFKLILPTIPGRMQLENPQFQQLLAGAASRLRLWEQVLQAAQAETVAEVGVWKGDYAQYLLEHCVSIKRYYMIDPWANLPDWNKPANVSAPRFAEVYEEALRKTAFAAARRVVLRGRTKEVIAQIPDQSLDFVYIDGDHTLRGITIDLIKLLPKVKEGGLIGGDDFTDNPWQHDARFEPTLVCPFAVYFAEAMDLPILALPFNQFLIQKRRGAAFSFTDTTGRYGNLSLNQLAAFPTGWAVKRRLAQALSKLGLARVRS